MVVIFVGVLVLSLLARHGAADQKTMSMKKFGSLWMRIPGLSGVTGVPSSGNGRGAQGLSLGAPVAQAQAVLSTSGATAVVTGSESREGAVTMAMNMHVAGRLARRMVAGVVDEAVDCFDAVAYAESGDERLHNVVEIAFRHRVFIGVAVAVPLVRNILGREHFQKKGLDYIKSERAAQAHKWGSAAR
jgi:hypothetical protein